MPKLGTRKLYSLMARELQEEQIKVGRDKLFEILKKNALLQKKKRRYVRTTNSQHWLKKYPNIIKGIIINRSEQVWVSDITYIRTDEGYCYLSMITDAYSRKIMGSCLSKTLSAEGCLSALEEALGQRISESPLIHHSDRGLQYCSKEYVEKLRSNNIGISMTENSDPYENALAERMNKTMKEEFLCLESFRTFEIAKKVVSESINIYNEERPHLSWQMMKPAEVHSKIVNPIRATLSWG